jgi:uncharacterized membrane protein
MALAAVPVVMSKRTQRRSGYGAGRAGDNRGSLIEPKERGVPVLLLVLLIIIVLFIVGFAVVKFLIWIAIILAILWLIGFFVRGAEGSRWYRW